MCRKQGDKRGRKWEFNPSAQPIQGLKAFQFPGTAHDFQEVPPVKIAGKHQEKQPPPTPNQQPRDRRCYITARELCSPLCVSMETRYVAATGGCADQIRGDSQLWPGRRPPAAWLVDTALLISSCCPRSGIRNTEPAQNNPGQFFSIFIHVFFISNDDSEERPFVANLTASTL